MNAISVARIRRCRCTGPNMTGTQGALQCRICDIVIWWLLGGVREVRVGRKRTKDERNRCGLGQGRTVCNPLQMEGQPNGYGTWDLERIVGGSGRSESKMRRQNLSESEGKSRGALCLA